MGLDLLEFTLAVEDAFGIFIPDADAEALLTPRHVVDYVQARVGPGTWAGCLEQRAFYRLRRAGIQVLSRPRAAFSPDTPWADLLHPRHHPRQWQLLQAATGLAPWPRLKPPLSWGPTAQTVGHTARTLAATAVASLLGPAEGMDRDDVERIVRALMVEHLGVTAFQWSDRFVKDLGLG